MFKSNFWPFCVQNCKYVVLLKFRNSLFFLNRLLILGNTVFNLLANSIGLGLVIMRLVSSAYNTNLAFLGVTLGKLFMYSKKIKG